MAPNTSKMWSTGIKIAFFQKIAKQSPGCWTPVCDAFALHYFTQHVSQFRRFNFWFEPISSEWDPSYEPTPGHGFLILF